MRLDDKTKADLCIGCAAVAGCYLVIVLAAWGISQGWW